MIHKYLMRIAVMLRPLGTISVHMTITEAQQTICPCHGCSAFQLLQRLEYKNGKEKLQEP